MVCPRCKFDALTEVEEQLSITTECVECGARNKMRLVTAPDDDGVVIFRCENCKDYSQATVRFTGDTQLD